MEASPPNSSDSGATSSTPPQSYSNLKISSDTQKMYESWRKRASVQEQNAIDFFSEILDRFGEDSALNLNDDNDDNDNLDDYDNYVFKSTTDSDNNSKDTKINSSSVSKGSSLPPLMEESTHVGNETSQLPGVQTADTSHSEHKHSSGSSSKSNSLKECKHCPKRHSLNAEKLDSSLRKLETWRKRASIQEQHVIDYFSGILDMYTNDESLSFADDVFLSLEESQSNNAHQLNKDDGERTETENKDGDYQQNISKGDGGTTKMIEKSGDTLPWHQKKIDDKDGECTRQVSNNNGETVMINVNVPEDIPAETITEGQDMFTTSEHFNVGSNGGDSRRQSEELDDIGMKEITILDKDLNETDLLYIDKSTTQTQSNYFPIPPRYNDYDVENSPPVSIPPPFTNTNQSNNTFSETSLPGETHKLESNSAPDVISRHTTNSELDASAEHDVVSQDTKNQTEKTPTVSGEPKETLEEVSDADKLRLSSNTIRIFESWRKKASTQEQCAVDFFTEILDEFLKDQPTSDTDELPSHLSSTLISPDASTSNLNSSRSKLGSTYRDSDTTHNDQRTSPDSSHNSPGSLHRNSSASHSSPITSKINPNYSADNQTSLTKNLVSSSTSSTATHRNPPLPPSTPPSTSTPSSKSSSSSSVRGKKKLFKKFTSKPEYKIELYKTNEGLGTIRENQSTSHGTILNKETKIDDFPNRSYSSISNMTSHHEKQDGGLSSAIEKTLKKKKNKHELVYSTVRAPRTKQKTNLHQMSGLSRSSMFP